MRRVTQLDEQGGDSALGTNANTQSRPRGSELEVGGVDSAKSQKPITILGEQSYWGSSDIDGRASATDDFRTKALRTLIIF